MKLHCSYCEQPITDDPDDDNRYRGCAVCEWLMHHACWNEALALDRLPCPTHTVTVPAEGRKREHSYVELCAGHSDIIGMNGEWESR